MIQFSIPQEKKARLILNTDAKNEVDDQFAIVHAILSEAIELNGIIAAHFGQERSQHSEEDSFAEVMHLVDLMHIHPEFPIIHGGKHAIPDDHTPVMSEGVQLIIDEAMKDDPRPLHIAFLGPLTDMASALMVAPQIRQRNIKVIWIGGRNWPCGGWEYNLQNDIAAASYVFQSDVELWQIPRDVYRMMPVGFPELYTKVHPYGQIGEYLCDNVIRFNNAEVGRPVGFRDFGDSPAVGVVLYEDCGEFEWRPAPAIDAQMHYVHTGKNRPIKVYKNINSRFILEDFFALLQLFHQN